MTRLQRRLQLEKRRQKKRRFIAGTLKNYTRRLFTLIFIFCLLASIIKLSPTDAFFTTGNPEVSEGFFFLIFEQQNAKHTGANLSLDRPFLFEEEEDVSDVTGEEADWNKNISGNKTLAAQSDGLQEHSGNDIKQPSPGETVEAEITITGIDFNVEEIFIPSVKLHYGNKSSFALSGEIDKASLVATFDLHEIWSWFQEALPLTGNVTLAVTGDGYQHDGSAFFFSGEVLIRLTGSYDVRAIEIVNPEVLFIPENEALTHELVLIDQDGLSLENASWKLVEPGEGISQEEKTGMLTAGPAAAGENILVEATLESQGRLHTDQAEIQFQLYPRLEIVGAESITVPSPGESIRKLYEIFSDQNIEFGDISWNITPAVKGAEVEEGGLVTVYEEAGAGFFTLAAQVEIMGHSFSVETEIELVTIPIGFVIVEGESRIIIPETEHLTTIYTATIFSPNGDAITDEHVSWHLETGSNSGLQLTADGMLTIEPHAIPGPITLVAASVRNPAIKGMKHITLEAPSKTEQDPDPEPDPASESEEDLIFDDRDSPKLIPQPEEDETDCHDQDVEDKTPSLQIEGETLLFIPADEKLHVFYRGLNEKGEEPAGLRWTIIGGNEPVGDEESLGCEETLENSEPVACDTLVKFFLDPESGELIVQPGVVEVTITIQVSLTFFNYTEEGEPKEVLLTDELEIELVYPVPCEIEDKKTDLVDEEEDEDAQQDEGKEDTVEPEKATDQKKNFESFLR